MQSGSAPLQCMESSTTYLFAHACIQATAFGAYLDVVVDNLSRAALWGRALPGLAGVLVPALESVTFACTHKVRALKRSRQCPL